MATAEVDNAAQMRRMEEYRKRQERLDQQHRELRTDEYPVDWMTHRTVITCMPISAVYACLSVVKSTPWKLKRLGIGEKVSLRWKWCQTERTAPDGTKTYDVGYTIWVTGGTEKQRELAENWLFEIAWYGGRRDREDGNIFEF